MLILGEIVVEKDLLSEMSAANYEPNDVSYNCLLAHLSPLKVGCIQSVWPFCNKLVSKISKRCQGILNAAVNCGNFEDAWDTIAKMELCLQVFAMHECRYITLIHRNADSVPFVIKNVLRNR